MTLRIVLVIIAVLCFLVFALSAHGSVTGSPFAGEEHTWLGVGLATFAGSFLAK